MGMSRPVIRAGEKNSNYRARLRERAVGRARSDDEPTHQEINLTPRLEKSLREIASTMIVMMISTLYVPDVVTLYPRFAYQ